MPITFTEQRKKLRNDVIRAELLLNNTSHLTVPCPCVYRKDPPSPHQIEIHPTCPYCLGSGSIRYGVEEIEFQ